MGATNLQIIGELIYRRRCHKHIPGVCVFARHVETIKMTFMFMFYDLNQYKHSLEGEVSYSEKLEN